ncbi:type VII secretion integral membrane protein EccD [Streptomyces tendae]|uniref:type VII secretion integral membrane protein EccD n=1 Tax=Streptomyces tendae TaxID=1932 RepID=UPI003D708A8E
MTDNSVANLCRITVRAPGVSIDLAVPSDVPVADLLPTVLRYAGKDIEEEGLEHGGWILQRLGDRPLDDEGTLDALEVRDGDILHLRPRTEALPEVRLDDLVDGIANVTRERLQGWTPAASRWLLRGMVVVALIIVLALLARPGSDASVRASVAGVAGLLLLAGGGSASRAVGDAEAGAVLGFMAAPCLALAGWLLLDGEIAGSQAYHVLGAKLLAAGVSGAGGAVLALAAVAVYTPLFLAAAVVGLTAAVAGGLMSLLDLSADSAAAVVSALVVLVGGFVPALSFRLAGMRMPPVPTTARQLQEGIEPYEGAEVAARTESASGWMTALYGATGVLCTGCLIILARRPNLPEALTAVALSLLLLLHGRGIVHIGQRLALVLPGATGALLMVIGATVEYGPAHRLWLVVMLLALGAVLAISSWTVPDRRMSPYWGRAAELFHSLLAITLLPLTLWVAGVFGALRAIAG